MFRHNARRYPFNIGYFPPENKDQNPTSVNPGIFAAPMDPAAMYAALMFPFSMPRLQLPPVALPVISETPETKESEIIKKPTMTPDSWVCLLQKELQKTPFNYTAVMNIWNMIPDYKNYLTGKRITFKSRPYTLNIREITYCFTLANQAKLKEVASFIYCSNPKKIAEIIAGEPPKKQVIILDLVLETALSTNYSVSESEPDFFITTYLDQFNTKNNYILDFCLAKINIQFPPSGLKDSKIKILENKLLSLKDKSAIPCEVSVAVPQETYPIAVSSNIPLQKFNEKNKRKISTKTISTKKSVDLKNDSKKKSDKSLVFFNINPKKKAQKVNLNDANVDVCIDTRAGREGLLFWKNIKEPSIVVSRACNRQLRLDKKKGKERTEPFCTKLMNIPKEILLAEYPTFEKKSETCPKKRKQNNKAKKQSDEALPAPSTPAPVISSEQEFVRKFVFNYDPYAFPELPMLSPLRSENSCDYSSEIKPSQHGMFAPTRELSGSLQKRDLPNGDSLPETAVEKPVLDWLESVWDTPKRELPPLVSPLRLERSRSLSSSWFTELPRIENIETSAVSPLRELSNNTKEPDNKRPKK